MLFVQYRRKNTQNFASRLKKMCDIKIDFKIRKLENACPS